MANYCDYCYPGEDSYLLCCKDYVESGEEKFIGMDIRDGILYVDDARKNLAKIDINFCPICGRQIRDMETGELLQCEIDPDD